MKKIICYFFMIAASGILLPSCNGQKADPVTKPVDLATYIQARLDSQIKKGSVPGILVAVIDSNQRKYFQAGYADPDKKKQFDSSTIVEIGSITKTFTAYVLESVLKDKGISDSSSIIKYLPDSVQTNKAFEQISFLNLLNHSAGLPRLPENMDLSTRSMQPYENYTEAQFYSYLKNCSPKPDGKSNYSNLGAALAGVLAQKISGKTYEALLNELIFIPFKIDTANKLIANVENKGQGYFQETKAEFWRMNIFEPAGAIKFSANEMLAYLQQLALPNSNTSKQIIDKLLQPTISLGPGLEIGRAWFILDKNKAAITCFHNGGTYGFSTFAAFSPGRKKAVFVVANRFSANTFTDELGLQIMKHLLE